MNIEHLQVTVIVVAVADILVSFIISFDGRRESAGRPTPAASSLLWIRSTEQPSRTHSRRNEDHHEHHKLSLTPLTVLLVPSGSISVVVL